MTQEMVTKYKCDRCGHTEEVKLESGIFGVRKGKPPSSWGEDLEGKVLLCPTCNKEYDQGYLHWFDSFMKRNK